MAGLRVILLALLIAASGDNSAMAKVLIAVTGPRDGPYASVAADIRRGAELAVERINGDGGIGGEPVEVIEADDGCAVGAATAAARTLVEKGVALVIGHPCAGAAIAAAKVYAQAGVVFIAPATRHAALTEPRAGSSVFRLAGRDDRQGTAAGAYVAQTFAGRPIAIVHDGSKAAKELAAKAVQALKATGATSLTTLAIVGGQKDYTKLIDKLRASQPQAVYYTGYAIEGGQLLRQMRRAGIDAAFIGSDALATDPFIDAARDAAEGAQALLPHDVSRDVAEATRQARFGGRKVGGVFGAAYAAVEAWAAAAKTAGSTAGAAVSEALGRNSFDTVIGTVRFDAKGDADVPAYDIVTWRKGAWQR